MFNEALLAMLIAQIPDGVTNEAVKAFDQGGFKAVAGVLLGMCVAEGFVCWKLYGAVREMAAEQLAFSKQAIESTKDGQALTREQIEAMKSLAAEVRAK